jgi:hypothetical protein
MVVVDDCVRIECLRVAQHCVYVCPATACCLMRVAAVVYDRVDLYNSATGAWSTAQLSVARYDLAATSVRNVALFGGGQSGSMLHRRRGDYEFDNI